MHGVFRFVTSTAARKSLRFTRFWGKLSVLSLLLEEFRRLHAIFIEFYTPNVVQAVFRVETGTAARNSYPFIRFWRKLSVISLLLEEFRRLNAIFNSFYTPNVVHAVIGVETGTAARKSLRFTRLWRKLSVVSLLSEEFRRLSAIFIAFHTPNVVHAVFGFETSTAAPKSQSLTRFWRNLFVISLVLEIFRSLNAIFIAFYTPNIVHAVIAVETSTAARKSLRFIRLWRNLSAISLLLVAFRRLNAILIAFHTLNAVQAVFSVETDTAAHKS